MNESIDLIRLLKRKIAKIERSKRLGDAKHVGIGHVGIGHVAIDSALGGGLGRGQVHEVFASEVGDAGSAAGFAAALGRRLEGATVWLREESSERQGGSLYGAGLLEIGIDPAQLILAVLPDPLAVLRAAADVVRCPEVSVAVIELWRQPRLFDLTASRRLALAAEESGVTAILLRIAAEPVPSAAQTRWRIAAAASAPLEANAPGHPTWEVELLRQRGRPAGNIWRVEWDRDRAMFRDDAAGKAPLSGAVVSFPADRSGDARHVIPLRRAG